MLVRPEQLSKTLSQNVTKSIKALVSILSTRKTDQQTTFKVPAAPDEPVLTLGLKVPQSPTVQDLEGQETQQIHFPRDCGTCSLGVSTQVDPCNPASPSQQQHSISDTACEKDRQVQKPGCLLPESCRPVSMLVAPDPSLATHPVSVKEAKRELLAHFLFAICTVRKNREETNISRRTKNLSFR